jgi:uncharacterized membrane protein
MITALPRLAIGTLLLVLLVMYPFGIYALLEKYGVFTLGIALVFLAACRLLPLVPSNPKLALLLACAGGLFLLVLGYSDSELLLKLYPTLINFGCLVTFSLTLIYPPSMIERIARLARMRMDRHSFSYTHKLTFVWCAFFAINGSIAGWYALNGSTQDWALYTGLYSYVAMGLLFAGEYIFRGYYKQRMRSLEAQDEL